MSLSNSSLFDQAAQLRVPQQSWVESLQKEANESVELHRKGMHELQCTLQSQQTSLEVRTNSFCELIEKERKDRNQLDHQKAQIAKDVGMRFAAGLTQVEEQVTEKLSRLKRELEVCDGDIERQYSAFNGHYETLKKQTPNAYMKEAEECVEEFAQARRRLEESVKRLEWDIQTSFRNAGDRRVEAADLLEAEISSAKKSLTETRSRLNNEIEAQKTNLYNLLTEAAQRLGLAG